MTSSDASNQSGAASSGARMLGMFVTMRPPVPIAPGALVEHDDEMWRVTSVFWRFDDKGRLEQVVAIAAPGSGTTNYYAAYEWAIITIILVAAPLVFAWFAPLLAKASLGYVLQWLVGVGLFLVFAALGLQVERRMKRRSLGAYLLLLLAMIGVLAGVVAAYAIAPGAEPLAWPDGYAAYFDRSIATYAVLWATLRATSVAVATVAVVGFGISAWDTGKKFGCGARATSSGDPDVLAEPALPGTLTWHAGRATSTRCPRPRSRPSSSPLRRCSRTAPCSGVPRR